MALGIVVLLVGFFLMTRFLGVGGLMGNTKQCHICGIRIESKNLQAHMRDAHGKS